MEVLSLQHDLPGGMSYAFANNIRTPEGGTHLVGFYTALTRTINDYGRRYKFLKEADANLKGEDVRESLAAVISAAWTEPSLKARAKSKTATARSGHRAAWWSERLGAYLEESSGAWPR